MQVTPVGHEHWNQVSLGAFEQSGGTQIGIVDEDSRQEICSESHLVG